ncbi:MAG: ribosome biogenesis/translation initiation ATPase RLI [Euryarchaeota archaeon]|jgi:ATP-binding cassette subfamily E protein 1|nr:ribosome biogenesis/translation initiation ATPase RLI [Euryarchaeota archaeon]MDA8551260.1 ribosome biogenesis/translation initiation ATPase RLI [Candidatus Poseidoniales archaeon]MDC3302804.1 ribosome biogenesis/translation initiation ATPase RLI [Candidatus Poseidoniaceae archaeon]MBT5122167.1 ribosome biogenesis/translation initiation ATPase RLI [Euryarchaeota archaeon]MBT5617693.1 ribosome biogenesis/translation initiation ATPase RLI [Euryarchaeota archaeon]
MRVAVLKEDSCQPKKCNDECHAFCPPVRNGQECIILDDKTGKPHISESLCIGCGICINKCPHDALIIEQLPSELESDMIHRYSMNGFRLFRLPTPSKESVVGILGPNGMGKSTAINALSGRMIPNLGDWLDKEADWDGVIETLPRGELRDFFVAVRDGKIKVALKPQNVDRLPKRVKGTVRDLLSKVDERKMFDEMTKKLGIDHLLDRTIQQLSGGELQRMAICATLLRDVDVYFFDEPSSYLDIHERMRIVRIIQDLATTKRVIVIEHDLAVLDVLCDLVHIVYGKKGAFGIFTPARSTRQAINTYLDGFLPEQNVRIRDKPIKFLNHSDRVAELGSQVVSWGGLGKTLGDFKLETGEGAVHRSEVVGVVGPNGTGKSTMIKVLAGEHEYDEGWVTSNASISYKPQHIHVDIDGSVQLWLDSEIGPRWRSGEFNVNVIRALGVDQLLPKRVKKLSGGERQAVSIAICLGREADLYLLDEPSAHLDANARMEAAKAIRRTMEANEKSAFVIDHDVYFIDIVSDSLLVFEGEGGRYGKAQGPFRLQEGMNRFLEGVNVTFRRDHDSKRPRINKTESRKDREQRTSGDFYSFNH